MVNVPKIQGDVARFTWDDVSLLSFAQCSKCVSKFPDKLGCSAFPEIIPAKYKVPKSEVRCPYYNQGFLEV